MVENLFVQVLDIIAVSTKFVVLQCLVEVGRNRVVVQVLHQICALHWTYLVCPKGNLCLLVLRQASQMLLGLSHER